MARRRGQQPNEAFDPDTIYNPEQAQTATEVKIPAESIDPNSALIAKDINDKVKALVEGLKGVKKVYLKKDENDDYAKFYENNKAVIERLLKTDLQTTYNKLVANAKHRNDLYRDFVEKGVINKNELNNLLGVVSNQPYLQYIQTLNNGKTEPNKLTPDDLDNLSSALVENFPIIVNDLKTAGKLTDAEVTRLQEIGPKTDQQIKDAREQIFAKIRSHDIRQNTNYYQLYEDTLNTEKALVDDVDHYTEQFNQVVEGLVKQIQEIYDEDQLKKRRQEKIRELNKKLGLRIKPGLTLTAEASGVPLNVEIKGVDFGREEEPELADQKKLLTPTLDPIVEFTFQPADGSAPPETYKLSSDNFQKWLIDKKAQEKIENVAHLHQALMLGEILKPGQKISYITYVMGPKGQPQEQEETVQITSINDQEVVFDKMVKIASGVSNGRIIKKDASTLSLPEFAKWYREVEAAPIFENLQQLDQALAKHHEHLVKEMDWPDGHGAPISLAAAALPLFLISAYQGDEGHPKTVSAAGPEGIEMDGKTISPHEFLRKVHQDGLTRPTAAQAEELKDIAKAQKDKDKETEFEKVAQAENLAPDAPMELPDEEGYFKSLWKGTTFLNLMDIYEVFINAPAGKFGEWLKGNAERRQATAGKAFWNGAPKFGAFDELSGGYEDKLNSKFSTDVKNTEEFFDKNADVKTVFEALYGAEDKVTLKACLQYLSKKGVLRWEDDEELWKALNRVIKPTLYDSKFDEVLGGKSRVIAGDKAPLRRTGLLNHELQCQFLIDSEFGDGTFESLSSSNENEYKKRKQKAADEMHKYENEKGGIFNQLRKMMYDFEQGNEVDPASFDGLLSKAMAALDGVNAEEGLLLYIAAFGVKNKYGRTLLTFSRTNPYIADLKDHIFFIYFAVPHEVMNPETGKPLTKEENGETKNVRRKLNLDDYNRIYNEVIKKDIEANSNVNQPYLKFTAGKNTSNWLRANVLTNYKYKERLPNKINDANVNVSLYHYVGPTAQEVEDVDKITKKGYGGIGKIEVVKNTYAGYNDQLNVAALRLNKGWDEDNNNLRNEEFARNINTFIYFNNVLKRKIKTREDYLELDESILDSSVPADKNKKRKVKHYVQENELYVMKVAKDVAEELGDQQLLMMIRKILEQGNITSDAEEKFFRGKLITAIKGLGEKKPEVLAEIAQKHTTVLKGMSVGKMTAAELEAMKFAAYP